MEGLTAADRDVIRATGDAYIRYLEVCLAALGEQNEKIEALFTALRSAKNIHVYGFGRSGTAALAFAIRLKHFSAFLPPVWWAGDQVREPVRAEDLVILVTQSGTREEVLVLAEKAKEAGAAVALITAEKNSAAAKSARLTILLPRLDEPFVYGGGDFELGAWFFQEVLVATMGSRFRIPSAEVWRNHV